MSNANDSDSTLTELDSEDLLPPQNPAPKTVSRKDDSKESKTTTKVHARKRKITTVTESADGTVELSQTTQVDVHISEETQKPKRKRQKKEKKEKEPTMPLAPRVSSLLRIGAHVSAAKGVQNAITNAVHIGYSTVLYNRGNGSGNSFGVFLKNQRRWEGAPFKKEDITQFRDLCYKENYDPKRDILPHGSYLVNLANPDQEKRLKAYEAFLDELKRCEVLGIGRHNFQYTSALYSINDSPGSASDKQLGIELIAECINKAHSETEHVKVVLENSAGGTNSIGATFEDLKGIIDLVKDQSRVGVCIDTCHAFAAGYDLRTKNVYDETWKQFDSIVGFNNLAGLHLNDSRSTLGSKRDLHANLGRGFLSLEPFRLIVNDTRFHSIPMILETPAPEQEIWAEEIKMLYWMIGKKADDPELLEREKVLQEKGREDREKQLDVLRRKAEKATKTPRKRKTQGGKNGVVSESSNESDSDSDSQM